MSSGGSGDVTGVVAAVGPGRFQAHATEPRLPISDMAACLGGKPPSRSEGFVVGAHRAAVSVATTRGINLQGA